MPESGNQDYWQQQPAPEQETAPPEASVASAEPISVPIATDTTPSSSSLPQSAPVVPEPAPLPVSPPNLQISWEAAEFIDHHKGIGWFAAFGLFAVAVLCVGIFLLKDWFATIGFVVMIVAVAVMALRPARILKYVLDDKGVHISEKLYTYQEFQSFSVQQEGEVWSVLLIPSARFKPALSIYFSREQGESIVDVLGQFLPMEEHKLDLIDRLVAKIRF